MILKLEPFSGISGDMFLGALAPLLDAEQEIMELPAKLGLGQVDVKFEDVIRSTIRCRKATVTLHGHAPASEHHEHSHHEHHHAHGHDPNHTHRAYTDIVELIRKADLTEGTRDLALKFFLKLGEAEAGMHGLPLAEVHFHEVGGEDAILDLVGAALLLDKLKPEAVFCTPICVGSGFVKTAHGRLPVPAPATQKLLEGMPTFPGAVEKEMTTPTGAAILSVLQPEFDLPVLITNHTGLGAGTRELDQPNALRASLCHAHRAMGMDAITLLETNLDNISGEDLGADLLEHLLEEGALDAWLSPILMKKGRPAQKLQILCRPGDAISLRSLLLKELPTLGIRQFEGRRQILDREIRAVSTPYGVLEVKVHVLPDGSERYFPEYESCRLMAETTGIPLQEIRDQGRQAAENSTG